MQKATCLTLKNEEMDKVYIDWIQELKQKIKSAQLKASIAVNEEMILLAYR